MNVSGIESAEPGRDSDPGPSADFPPDPSAHNHLHLLQPPTADRNPGGQAVRRLNFERAGERFGAAARRRFARDEAERPPRQRARMLSIVPPPARQPDAGGYDVAAPAPVRAMPPAIEIAPPAFAPELRARVEAHLRTLDGVHVVADPETGLIRIEPQVSPTSSRVGNEVPLQVVERGPGPAAAIQAATTLLRVPGVHRGLASAVGATRADLITVAIDLAAWGATRRAGGTAQRRRVAPAIAPVTKLNLPWSQPGQSRSLFLLALTSLGAVVLLLGTTPLGSIVCALFPSPVIAALVSVSGIAAAFLQ
jgi:hypothetical protein